MDLQEGYSDEQLKKKKVPELKEILKTKNLLVSGSKEVLIKRILEFLFRRKFIY